MMNTNVFTGRVIDSDGKGIGEARVCIVRGPQPFQDIASLTDSQGGFTISFPSEGIYEIGVFADGYLKKSFPFDTENNETKEKKIILELK